MPVIMVFQKNPELLSISEISHSLTELLGLTCGVMIDGKKVDIDDYDGATRELTQGTIYVDLPDLEEDEGQPVLDFAATPRLDRDDEMQGFIDEILEQEDSLRAELDENTRDIMITSSEDPAAIEAASAIAYVVASETESGILVRTSDEDDDTVWFADAEQFADFVFGEEEEVDDEELDDEDE
ncbi:MAG: hypothetical protein RBU21_22465 [FCB group bacterium]|nr:hypothetical protein [FCB group bacterium]